jgi:hypothetical protein
MEKAATEHRSTFHTWKYAAVIILMLASLVFSKWLLSVSQMLFLLIIVSDKGGLKRLGKAFLNPLVLVLISVYVFHVAGLLWSDDMKYATHDLRMKLPLLSFPILFAAAPPFGRNKTILLIKSFVFFMAIMTIINLIRFFILPHSIDFQPALWHSHIRFSLMLCLSIFMIIWLLFNKELSRIEQFIAPLFLAIFLVFLFLLESFTGLVIIALMIPFMAILFRNYVKNFTIKFIVSVILISGVIISFYSIFSVKRSFFPETSVPKVETLDKTTASGNKYIHDPISNLTENGTLVYQYICLEEIKNEWNKRSNKKLSEETIWHDANILMRYLSSKGLRKDSVGVWALSEEDIANIENNIPNYRLLQLDPIRERVYQFFWELNLYENTNNPSGHSLTQRMEYWKAAVKIIGENFWIGVGTGDVNTAFDKMYIQMNTLLYEQYRLRAHNQFLTFWLSFGIFGFLLFIISLIYPFTIKVHRHNLLYIGFIFIFLLSMLNEDTLETQVGVSFYALFNSFFLFAFSLKEQMKDKSEK